jgi:4-hydroxy-3-methylbut-2-enyl diphosphate reductase
MLQKQSNDVQPMRVILAQPRGFCAGVVRAIEIVERSLQKYGAPVYVRHEIVHNKAVVQGLKAKGAEFVDELDSVPADAVTVFSAHGVARDVEADASARGLHVLDATCPLVTKVHIQGRKYAAAGRVVVLIGHAGHAEVEGTMGQIDGRVVLVQDVREAEQLDLPPDAPLAYVTQTTLSVDDTREVIAVLQRRFADIVGPDVRDICTESGIPSYLLADGSELDPAWVRGARVVGITAGASAPEAMVDDVIATLRALAPVQVSSMDGLAEHIEFRLPQELTGAAGPG